MDFSVSPSAVLAGVDFDWLPESMKLFINNSQLSGSCGDGSPTSPPQPQPLITPPPSNYNYNYINHNHNHNHNHNIIHQTLPFLTPNSLTTTLRSNSNDLLQRTVSSTSSPPSAGPDDLLKPSLFAAADFQKKNERAESPVSCESSITIEGMSRACRYSPEEKKERIERYRTKRNQRNFNKKIKYACRKSLADSRPRIRGRFARYNDDVAKKYPVQWSSHGREEEEEEANGGENWIEYFMDAYSANLIP